MVLLAVGFALGACCVYVARPVPASAVGANSNDKFSMATVPVTLARDSEAVFVLDHLTGVLRGGILSSQTGTFSFTFLRNIAADFQLNPATPDPRYSIVGGPASLRSGGGSQPANGVVYIAELSSGAVIAYGFEIPRGRGSAAPMQMIKLDGFSFREAAGG